MTGLNSQHMWPKSHSGFLNRHDSRLWNWKSFQNPTSDSEEIWIWVQKVPWQKFDFLPPLQIDFILLWRCPTLNFLVKFNYQTSVNIILKPQICNPTDIPEIMKNMFATPFVERPLYSETRTGDGEVKSLYRLFYEPVSLCRSGSLHKVNWLVRCIGEVNRRFMNPDWVVM